MGAACSSSNDRDDDDKADAGQQQTDGGDKTDGGDQTDGGNNECPLETDCAIAACAGRVCGNGGMCSGGACVTPTQIGDSCSGATEAKPQGTCSDGQFCSDAEFAIFSRKSTDGPTTCTKECVTDVDCGKTNGVDNSCVQIGENFSVCVKGCTPGGSDCQNDTICLTYGQPPNGTNACVEQCTKNSDCIFGMTCSSAGAGIKVCNPEVCPAGGLCGEGRACQTFGQQKYCVDACSDENPCANGLTCDTGTGLCKAHAGNYYQVCNQQTPCTEEDAICITSQAGDSGTCMQKCAEGMCGEGDPAGTVCGIQTTTGVSMCALPCTQATTCPTGSSCKSLGGGQSFCLP